MKKCSNCGQEFEGNFCPACGTRAAEDKNPSAAGGEVAVASSAAQVQAVQTPPAQIVYAQSAYPESKFTGGAFANFFITWISRIITLITLFLAYPAMRCWHLRWKYRHTYYNGVQLIFTGKAIRLMGRYLLWWLLSIVTIGIYYIVFMKVAMVKWETSNVHIANGNPEAESSFDGHWYQLLGVSLLTGFVTLITIFLGSFWAHCYKLKWFAKHKTIDGARIEFDGSGLQYFGKKIAWWLLTIITVFIYSFWRKVKVEKWNVKHTHFVDPSAVGVAHAANAVPVASAPVHYVKNEKGEFVPVAVQPAQQSQSQSKTFIIAGAIMMIMPMTSIVGLILLIVGLVKMNQEKKAAATVVTVVNSAPADGTANADSAEVTAETAPADGAANEADDSETEVAATDSAAKSEDSEDTEDT